ncbi:MAG: FtsW/RodA/SpoVE family cell cycle protein, partial [Candidatus Omnitrophica bacterium]|nr:FtsW/RodA/SpoVE family cell cycle protein [Candidatus Omnitrophota bacterium]
MRNSIPVILIIAILISCLGVISIYSSTYQKEGKLWETIYQRQILWVILGLLFFLIVSNTNYRYFLDWTYFLYAAMLLFLVFVAALGAVR